MGQWMEMDLSPHFLQEEESSLRVARNPLQVTIITRIQYSVGQTTLQREGRGKNFLNDICRVGLCVLGLGVSEGLMVPAMVFGDMWFLQCAIQSFDAFVKP